MEATDAAYGSYARGECQEAGSLDYWQHARSLIPHHDVPRTRPVAGSKRHSTSQENESHHVLPINIQPTATSADDQAVRSAFGTMHSAPCIWHHVFGTMCTQGVRCGGTAGGGGIAPAGGAATAGPGSCACPARTRRRGHGCVAGRHCSARAPRRRPAFACGPSSPWRSHCCGPPGWPLHGTTGCDGIRQYVWVPDQCEVDMPVLQVKKLGQ